MPKDEKLREKLFINTDINEKYDSLYAIDNLLIAFGISMGIGLLWMILVQFFPKAMVSVSIILAILLLLILAIVFFVNSGGSLSKATGWVIIIGIISLITCILLIIYLYLHRK